MLQRMSPEARRVLTFVGAYVITMGVTGCMLSVTIAWLMFNPQSCSAMGRALSVLWMTVAVGFLVSTAVVGFAARKLIPSVVARRVAVAAYAEVMLASYVVVAFVLLVAFNC